MLIACGDDGSDAPVDASPDAPLLPGDFSCVGKPLDTVAPDPLTVKGTAISVAGAGIAGVEVEVHSSADDTLLGQATSASVMTSRGSYSVSVATGGAAPRLYRYLHATGYVDSYGYDPRPVIATSPSIATPMLMPDALDAYYATAGITRDPSLATAWLDIHDCGTMDSYLAGATVEAPTAAGVFYLDDALAIDTSLTATKSGAVMILNVPPGVVDFAVHAGPLTYSSWPITVRAGAFTSSDRFP